MKSRGRWGPVIVVVALVGMLLVAFPLLGIGDDVSPDASGHLERRYGNIGLGLAKLWLVVMAVVVVIGLTMTVMSSRRRSS